MERKDFVILIIGILLFVLLFVVLVILVCYKPGRKFMLPDHLDSSTCPEDFSPFPVILISLDGFHPDYFKKGVTPTLKQMKEKGSFTRYMTPSFPSLTFPNHYSIVTGMYTDWHGIISNSFYDPRYKATFSYKNEELRKGRWWGGEPIWNTVNKNNLSSATYFWVGSEAPIKGQYPTYWFRYNQTIPLHQRPAQILHWLKLPASKRPSWISLYSHEPDMAGHKFGPNSDELVTELKRVDEMVMLILEGLNKENLLPCVNFMIVSDHGMASTGEEKVVHLERFMPEDLWDKVYFNPGAFGRISLKKEYKEKRKDLEKSLACKKEFHTFRREELPKRLHYSRDERIGDYVLLMEEGFSVNLNSSFFMQGIHGYDNHKPSMQSLFLAYGPAFKENFEMKPFQNIELYNLMCRLLNIPPAPNNGTWGLLDTILKNPPPILKSSKNYRRAPILKLTEGAEWKKNYDAFDCYKDDNTIESLVKLLDMNKERLSTLEETLCPWGIPWAAAKSRANFTLLFHPDHVTGYSTNMKTPLWTSFAVTKTPSGKANSHWLNDIRLYRNISLNCDEYKAMSSYGSDWTMAPLFPSEFSLNETTKLLSHLISNGVLFTTQFQKNWNDLILTLIPKWLKTSQSPLNVVLGPVFDRDSNGLMDDNFSMGNETAMPTDYFAIITKCTAEVQDLRDCPEEHLDSLAFVYPQNLTVEICFKLSEEFAQMFSAKIRDVELLTGLNFFSEIAFRQKLELATKEFSGLW